MGDLLCRVGDSPFGVQSFHLERTVAALSRRRLPRAGWRGSGLSPLGILLDVTIVNVALPSIQRELHESSGELEWVISAYALSLAALIPLSGSLGDHAASRPRQGSIAGGLRFPGIEPAGGFRYAI